MQFFNFISLFLFVSSLFLLIKWKNSNSKTKRLPPGPWKLPLLGSMFHLLGGLPQHVLRDLAKKYGPIMHLQLGEVSLVVITSPDMAKEVLKTHDLAFASRPQLLASKILFYNGTDIVFSPYGDYWRQIRKICLLELLSTKNVKSFSSIRQDEVLRMIEFFRSSSGETVNVTKRIYQFTNTMLCRSAFGKVFKEQDELLRLIKRTSDFADGFDVADIFPSLKFLHVLFGKKGKIMDAHRELDVILENIINEHKNNGELLGGEGLVSSLLRLMKEGGFQFPITDDNIKAIIYDMFVGGTETSSITIDWAMVEMMRNPSVFFKAQAEVRNAFRGKETFNDNDVEELKYLKLVIKETFRLHPPAPLLVPRECREEVDINGYIIPLKTKLMVNTWAIGRDPKYWTDVESFKPERLELNSMDFIGNNFQFLPFGGGRRNCPGMSFGLANIFFPLAQLLYHFDWKLPPGIKPSDLDLSESAGAISGRKSSLYLIATPHQPCQDNEGHVVWGTETSSTTIDWAMVEMIRNPSVLFKAQVEVRNKTFDENDVEELKYLKLVIKETFRLHPPIPLLMPRECREEVDIKAYIIPLKTKVMVNVWAIGRDPKYWNDVESFKPERFDELNSMDFIGSNFQYLPFGSRRRNCPGISFGLANVFFPLAQLLYHFDWKLSSGINPSDLDLTESAGAS